MGRQRRDVHATGPVFVRRRIDPVTVSFLKLDVGLLTLYVSASVQNRPGRQSSISPISDQSGESIDVVTSDAPDDIDPDSVFAYQADSPDGCH
jgi:hypothetical protein